MSKADSELCGCRTSPSSGPQMEDLGEAWARVTGHSEETARDTAQPSMPDEAAGSLNNPLEKTLARSTPHR